jgi:membrane protein implicated in regulation of membrane protease activity
MPYIWAAVLVALILIETQTADMVTIWFMPSALITLILALFELDIWLQCTVFVLLTTVMLILSKTVFRSVFQKKAPERTNADALIGQEALILEPIDNAQGLGSAKLHGLVWSARAANENDVFVPGDIVIVKAISGVKLICVKKDA